MKTPTRTILVTGGNRGIGLATVAQLAREGHRVLLTARDRAEGQAAAAPLQKAGFAVEALMLDVADPTSIDKLIAQLAQQKTTVDGLVNNAGVLHHDSLLSLDLAAVDATFAVQVRGPWLLARALVPGMIERGYGRIVNVSSGWGAFSEGLGGPAFYGITKAALNALTVRLAAELPATVKVNAMCPGWVQTRMGGTQAPRSPEQGADTSVWLATLAESGPTGGFFRDRQPIAW
ncbi:MAG: SDR family NAD(P)-dependent oxidoreductase [Gemmataceae bacterium]